VAQAEKNSKRSKAIIKTVKMVYIIHKFTHQFSGILGMGHL